MLMTVLEGCMMVCCPSFQTLNGWQKILPLIIVKNNIINTNNNETLKMKKSTLHKTNISKYFIIFIYCGGGTQMCHMSGGQKTTFWSEFSPSTMWKMTIKLRLSIW